MQASKHKRQIIWLLFTGHAAPCYPVLPSPQALWVSSALTGRHQGVHRLSCGSDSARNVQERTFTSPVTHFRVTADRKSASRGCNSCTTPLKLFHQKWCSCYLEVSMEVSLTNQVEVAASQLQSLTQLINGRVQVHIHLWRQLWQTISLLLGNHKRLWETWHISGWLLMGSIS